MNCTFSLVTVDVVTISLVPATTDSTRPPPFPSHDTGVLSPAECAATRDDVWDYLENLHGVTWSHTSQDDKHDDGGKKRKAEGSPSGVGGGIGSGGGDSVGEVGSGAEPPLPSKTQPQQQQPLRRDDPSTYGALSSVTYGLAPEPAIFSPQLVRNRQNPLVVSSLARTLSCAGQDVIVSQDRWCVYRPTRNVPMAAAVTATGGWGGDACSTLAAAGRTAAAAAAGSTAATAVMTRCDMPEWRTRGNLHLDLNPWTYNAGRSDAVPADTLTFDHLRRGRRVYKYT